MIEPEDHATLLASDPHNVVRLILPDSYDEAATTFAEWRAQGVLLEDAEPTFSVYRMTFAADDGTPLTTTGVIGALRLEPGGVLPHERTLPKAKSDRLELLRATRANFEPIWGISLASGLTELIGVDGAPDAVATDGAGNRHELVIVDDPERIAAIRDAVAGAGLVLADGHHRYETSTTYHAEHRDDDGAGLIMMLVVELADEQLCVHAIHRLVDGIGELDLRAAVAPWFVVVDAGANTPEGVVALEAAMAERGALGLVDRVGLARLEPRPELAAAMAALPEALHDVDSARFDTGVRPVTGAATLAYRNDARVVAAQVDTGAADAAVLLRPVSVADIRAAAAAGVRMPEKTTFFAPKPRSGMVMRSLD